MLTKENLETSLIRLLKSSKPLNNKVVNTISNRKIIADDVKVFEVNDNGASYLMLPANQDIEIIEKALSKLVISSFESAVESKQFINTYSNKKIILNDKLREQDFKFNEYYKNFNSIKLKNGLTVLYQVAPIYAVDSIMKINKSLLDDIEENGVNIDDLVDANTFEVREIESYTLEISIIYS